MKFSLGASFSTTNINSKLNTTNHSIEFPPSKYAKSPDYFKNPYVEPVKLKFPKKLIRKPTPMNMLIETQQISRRSSVKNFSRANSSDLFDNTLSIKKLKSPGKFHRNSKESLAIKIQNRSFEDLGIGKNKRGERYKAKPKADPIMIGEDKKETKVHYEKVWKEKRKWRDYGERISDKFSWNVKKKKGYLQKFQTAQRYAK